ncbi:MAG: PLP-dependent aminotransferase family protein [Chloroflexota bacterium]
MAIDFTRTSRRIEPLRESVWLTVDAMFEQNPDMIFFGNGAPALDLMPADRLAAASAEVFRDGPGLLSYGETEGYAPLRDLIVEQMAAIGAPAAADGIIVVNGSQEGMDIVGRTLLQEGDIVLVEGPTFPDAIRLYQSHDAEVVAMPMDGQGIVVEALPALLDRLPRTPKFLYTIPTFQNPSGTTLPLDRRHALVELARERGILLVEDDPYSAFRYDGDPLPPLRALEPDSVYLGTFSKTIAPGLRVGWISAPEPLLRHFFAVKEVMSISNSRLATRVVYNAARDGFLDAHLAEVRDAYRLRRDTLLAAMEEYLPPQATWVRPEGGFFVWVDLPEDADTDALLAKAAANGVIFLPSSWFFPGRGRRNGFRLSFSAIPVEQMAEGVRRIGQVLV